MFNKFKNKLTENKKNIFKLSSGTIFGQGIYLVTLPLITRIFGAEIIGILTFLIAIAAIIRSISDLGLTNSLMIGNQKNLILTYRVISTINLLLSILSALLISIYLNKIHEYDINIIFLFITILIIIYTDQQIQVSYTWLNRMKHYNILMYNPIIKNGIFCVGSIIFGILGMKLNGYLIAYILGQVITLIHMKRNLPKYSYTFKIKDFKQSIKDNKRFVIYQLPTNILSNLKNQLPTILIQSLWGPQILGYYSITVKVLQVPSSLLANAIGRVFFQTVSNMKRQGEDIAQYVLNNMLKGIKLAIIPMILLISFGEIGAVILLGADWSIVGDFIKILALMYFFIFLMNTVQGLAITLEKQNITLLTNIIQIICFFIGAYLGKYYFDSIYIGLLLMSVSYIIIQIIYFSILFKVMKAPIIKYIKVTIISLFLILLTSYTIIKLLEFIGL